LSGSKGTVLGGIKIIQRGFRGTVATRWLRERLAIAPFLAVWGLFLTRVFGTVVKEKIASVMVLQNPKSSNGPHCDER
jgi:hypothetical protein